jgi:hypothetical protein
MDTRYQIVQAVAPEIMHPVNNEIPDFHGRPVLSEEQGIFNLREFFFQSVCRWSVIICRVNKISIGTRAQAGTAVIQPGKVMDVRERTKSKQVMR